jgi:formylglycine-generating enzyme required for sulfatase activity
MTDAPPDRREAFTAKIDRLAREPVSTFRALVDSVGLDPLQELRFHDFAGCPFDRQDLRRFDLTGCNLRNTTFKGALIQGAIFDLAAVGLGALKQAADFEAWLKADLARKPEARRKINPSRLPDLAEFREAPFAPEMVVIPAGEFLMGSDESDDEAFPDEKMPDGEKRRMVIPERFALGKYPVTFEEYDLFCAAEKREPPKDREWGRDRRPVIDVSWNDANAYARWLNERLGVEAYGLPSEAQWEYACRGGTNTRRWWGDAWDPTRANGARSFEEGRTSPVGHYGDKGENPFHLSDMIGNVWEWCADAWTEKLSDLPADGKPHGPPPSRNRKQQKQKADSPGRALRGGSWYYDPRNLRSALRDGDGPGFRTDVVGFRLSRTL